MNVYKVGQIWERNGDGAKLKIVEVYHNTGPPILKFSWLEHPTDRYKGKIDQAAGLGGGWHLINPYLALYRRMIELINEQI